MWCSPSEFTCGEFTLKRWRIDVCSGGWSFVCELRKAAYERPLRGAIHTEIIDGLPHNQRWATWPQRRTPEAGPSERGHSVSTANIHLRFESSDLKVWDEWIDQSLATKTLFYSLTGHIFGISSIWLEFRTYDALSFSIMNGRLYLERDKFTW